MSDLIKKAYESMQPDGSASAVEVGGDLDKTYDGIAENENRVKVFLDTLAKLRDPQLTPLLEDLEKEYGILTPNNPNQVIDGDMEDDNVTAWSSASATLTKSTADPQGAGEEGYQALRLTSYVSGGIAATNSAVISTGKEVILSGWARADGTSGVYPTIIYGSGWTGTTSTAWQYFEIKYTTSSSVFSLSAVNAGIGSWVEFDNVSLTNDIEQQRRDTLSSLVYATRGSGSRSYMEARLHEAGFTDLFVYDNSPAVNPNQFITYGSGTFCGDVESVAGNEEAFCSSYDGGEYVVNGDGKLEYSVPEAEDSADLLIDGDMEDATVNATDWPTEEGGVDATKSTVDPYAGARSLQVSDSRTLDTLDGESGVGSLPDSITINGTTVAPTFVYRGGDGVAPDLGPELVVDGDMEAAGTAAWSVVNSSILSKETVFPVEGLQCLRVQDNGASTSPGAQQTMLTIGDTYLLSGYARPKNDGVSQPRVQITSGAYIWLGDATDPQWQRFKIVFTATNISLRFLSLFSASGYTEWDQISVKKINPVYGAQLLADGDMEAAGVGAWLVGNLSIITKSTADPHGGAQALRVAYGTLANPYAYQTIGGPGKSYRIRGWARGDGTNFPEVYFIGVEWAGTPSTAWQYFDVESTTTVSTRFRLRATGTGWAEFDDVTVQEIHYNGGYLPAHVGDDLYTADTGAAIDWDVTSYGNGTDDEAIFGNVDQYLQASGTTYGNIGTNDGGFRVGFYSTGTTSVLLAKRDGGVGWEIGIDASDRLYCTIQDSSGSTTIVSAVLGIGQLHLADIWLDRSGSGQIVIGGAASGAAVVISGRALTLDSATALTMLADSGGNSPTDGGIVYFGMWQSASWFSTHLNTTESTVDFQKYTNIYPDLSRGTPEATIVNLEKTFIEKYIAADAATYLNYVSDDVAPVGRILDSSGYNEFEAIRLCFGNENLFGYSNDFDTGWGKANCTINTSTIEETPSKGLYYQGIVADNTGGSTENLIALSVSTTAGNYCFSTIVKKADKDWVRIGDRTNGNYRYFDIANATPGTINGTLADSGIVDMGNGNLLVWIVSLCSSGTTNFGVFAAEDDDDRLFDGDGETVDTWVSFAQVEPGIYPGPRILTEGAADTRATDEITYDISDGNVVQGQGTIKFNILIPDGIPTTTSKFLYLNDGTITNEIYIEIEATTGYPRVTVSTGGVFQSLTIAPINVADGNIHTVRITYEDGDIRIYTGNTFRASGSPAAIPTGLTVATLIGTEGTKWISELKFYGELVYIATEEPALVRAITQGQSYHVIGYGKSTYTGTAPEIKDGTTTLWAGPGTDTDWDFFEFDFVAGSTELKLTMDALEGIVGFDNLAIYERSYPGNWNLVFFVGGAVTRDGSGSIIDIDRVDIPEELRESLRRIILRHKPLQTWGALVVNYTE